MSWEDLLGQEAALERLHQAYTQGRLAHALAFVGPPGVGKRLAAKQFAQAILCEAKPRNGRVQAFASCGHCMACKLVQSETHPDLLFGRTPEDKSEFPVEQLRGILEQVTLKPTRGLGQVILMEDADDFNEESANAFLKTLEEPPVGTEIILISSGIERLLPTVRSRVQPIPFRALPAEVVDELLMRHGVVDAEERRFLVEQSGGSIGQALALRDPVIRQLYGSLQKWLTSSRKSSVQLAREWMQFAESAGKEASQQRQRAAIVIPLLLSLLREQYREAAQAEDSSRLTHLESQLEAVLQAQWYFERRVQTVLVVEQCADRLMISP